MNDHTSAYFEGIKECRIEIHIASQMKLCMRVIQKVNIFEISRTNSSVKILCLS